VVRRAIVGPAALARLTVLLQGLVAERVPITDWRAILDAVVTAGGIDTPIGDLHRAVRLRLRATLPGPRTGPAVVRVPPDIQARLHAEHEDPAFAADRDQARLRFLGWLRRLLVKHRSVISLVTDTTATRVAVAALARAERALVLTFTLEELDAGWVR
jgi:flagellar biosynthesis component FlhA